MGLWNVYRRLTLYYGREFAFEIHSDFGKGTLCTISIPAGIRGGAGRKRGSRGVRGQVMYSIMIVDDEKAIRENLPVIINFGEYGFQICGMARNGEDAFSQLLQCRPDVVFLDVCMPVMDGIGFLQAIQELREQDRPYVVMLSGYSDFEYARTAMRYGVKAYLTKPVDADDVAAVLSELSAALEERRERTKEAGLYEMVRIFRELYHGADIGRSVLKGCRVMHCVILEREEASENGWPAIRGLIEERLPGGGAAFIRSRGSILSYLISPRALDGYQRNEMLFGRHLLHHFKNQGVQCALLFDSLLWEESGNTFRVDHDAHLYQMLTEVFWGGNGIRQNGAGEMTAFQDRRLDGEEEYLEDIKRAVRDRDMERLREVYDALCGAVEGSRLNILYLQEVSHRVCYGLTDLLSEAGAGERELEPLDWRDAPCFIRYQEWKEKLWAQISAVAAYRKRVGALKRQDIAAQALAYVESHFREQISLASVSEHFYITASHMGRLLRNLTGASFKQYVNGLRIEEAKRLLRDTDRLIYEIAEETGFAESKYFVSRFTAQVGMTPLEYRKACRNEGNI